MEALQLAVPADLSDPTEDPDFVSRTRGAMLWVPKLPVAGAPPLFHNVRGNFPPGATAAAGERARGVRPPCLVPGVASVV